MIEAPEISAVVPCLNEAENVSAIYNAIAEQLGQHASSFEIIFIDNASSDQTAELIRDICQKDKRVRLIINNKNYGQLRSPIHAVYQATGRAVIGISADFQDPPEMIGELIARWRRGSMIVLGVRRSERAPMALRMLRSLGYAFFSNFGDYRVIPGATGFGLYDIAVIDCLRQWREPEPFFRGMLVESGYPVDVIEYDRPQRRSGSSKNNLFTLIEFAITGLAASSRQLLRIPLLLSIIIFIIWGALTLFLGIIALFIPIRISIFLLDIFLLFAGALFFSIGLIGEQVRVMSLILRNAPLVVEKERVNFPTR